MQWPSSHSGSIVRYTACCQCQQVWVMFCVSDSCWCAVKLSSAIVTHTQHDNLLNPLLELELRQQQHKQCLAGSVAVQPSPCWQCTTGIWEGQ